ncbi:sortilin-related receptor isoform X2 [Anabrus simplex]
MCLARDPSPHSPPRPSALFISYNYGDTFEEKTENFKLDSDGQYASIDKYYNHPKVISHSIFADITNKLIFTSSNYGKNFTKVKLSFTPSDVVFNEFDPHVFLVHDKSDTGKRKLWLTRDFGATWTVVQESVKTFYWSSSLQEDVPSLLYVEREEPTGLSTVLSSPDLFASESTYSVVISEVKDFQVKGDFMFATRQVSGSNLDLYVSHKGKPFMRAQFESELNRRDYYVADVSDGQVMVAVGHTEYLANLYISERLDGSVMKFTLSLERILCHFPNSTWTDTWLNNVAEESFADLHKVQGLKGIYIASQVQNMSFPAQIGPEVVSTVISFDHGAEWNPIKSPEYDDRGNKINCNMTLGCSLHLSQKLNQLYPVSRAVPILSSKSAPGIIMATGTIGTSLKGRPGLFISTDAGLTWRQALKDYYFFNFGDHGGVMVAVKYYRSHGETREILYSTDEGENWKTANFSDKDLLMYGLMTEPGENTTVFTMFGSDRGAHQWLVIKIDLQSVFDYNCSKERDYKFWSPSSSAGPHISCIMGRRETYERRVAHSNCFNGRNYDRPIRIEKCECFAEDFECDYGFVRYPGTRHCIRNKTSSSNPYDVPTTCKPGQFYNRTKGYMKLPDDPCEGGNELLFLPDVLPCPVEEKAEFLLVAQRDRIVRVDLSTLVMETLPIMGLHNAIAVEFDMNTNCVYWADVVTDTIGRTCLNNGEREILVDKDLASIEGMALDWVSNNLYFVDGMKAKIEVVRTDLHNEGRMRRTILGPEQGIKKPRGIAVHPMQGYMYWTDWAPGDSCVNRANLDGSNIKRLFKSPMVQWPNGVTIDHIAERIYWVDAREDYIASADLDGRHYRKIISNDEHVSHPFAVAVFKDTMYWDDWQKNSIFQADKDSGLYITALHTRLSGLMDLKIFAHSIQKGTNLCANRTAAGCDYLCMGMPGNKRACLCPEEMNMVNGACVCPDGSKPSVNGTCKQIGSTCAHDYFKCNNGACIPNLWKCDGDDDCGDVSDEHGCREITCNVNQFQCGDGKCIPRMWQCDFDTDCVDGSDEEHCNYQACKPNQFKCKNERCILKLWQCDSEDDCKDGSDEVNCTHSTSATCRPGEFRCDNNSQCIPNSWRCDGERDCNDSSDEANCSNSTCESWQFQCKNHRCIFPAWKCDGDDDCRDNSDEENCPTNVSTTAVPIPPQLPTNTCNGWMFLCNNKKCVPYWWKCDGVDDCGDSSDEYGCDPDGVVNTTAVPLPTQPTSSGCDRHQFQCGTGECILDAWLCDGMNDCTNGDDEKNCKDTIRCREDEFTCRRDGSCVPRKKVCDQVRDCPDGTDEDEFCTTHTTHIPDGIVHGCAQGRFLCDFNRCLPSALLCNGRQDCYDGSDENKCSNHSQVLQVLTIGVDRTGITESSFTITWAAPADKNESLVYLPTWRELDVKEAKWYNASKWVAGSIFTFKDLHANSRYNATVYVRKAGSDKVYPPAIYVQATTLEGVPSPPWNVTLMQKSGNKIEVSWHAPAQPKGVIKNYFVHYTPPIPPVVGIVPGHNTKAIVESGFEGGSNYSFWVEAENGRHKSNSSKVATITFDGNSIIDPVQGLVIPSKTNHSTTLSWKMVAGAEGYYITPRSTPPFPNLPRICVKNVTTYTVDNLAPGTPYNFDVSAFKKNFEGPTSTVTAKTEGIPLKEVNQLVASLVKGHGTTVFLQWKAPQDNRTSNWTYGIYYAINPKKLFEGPKATTQNLNFTVPHLAACESYVFDVGVVGPLGSGPLSDSPPAHVFTQFNMNAAPKNVRAYTDPKDETKMIVSWNSSCPTMTNKTGYQINIREVNLNKISSTTLLPTSGTALSFSFNVHYGGQYAVTVQTTSPGANASQVVYYSAPPVQGPHQLEVLIEKNGSFFINWKEGELPAPIQNMSRSYKILVSPGDKLNESDAKEYEVAKGPPFTISDLQEGVTYTFAVVLELGDGYRFKSEEFTNIDSSKASWSVSLNPMGLASVVVPILIVLIALMAALAFFVFRHRRLQRSFASFANSHYDTRSGAATFSGGDGLDEEDSPVIRGFSDDEPLVIA